MKGEKMQRALNLCIIFCLVIILPLSAFATNGDNLIGIGPSSRSMGGVGIAAPQDAIGSIFTNPAAMCFGTYCPGSEFNFSGTLFMPKVEARIELDGKTYKADSSKNKYAIPAIGLSVPITDSLPFWRFGLAAYGVSGLGVDYRETAIDQPGFADFGGNPLVAGTFTQLQIMKFAPAIAFQPNPQFSLGLALHIDHATLDLGKGASFNYGFGGKLGALFKLSNLVSIGAIYVSPQKTKHEKVENFDGIGGKDDLELEAPQELGVGAALNLIADTLLFEINGKWLNWGSAKGYDDFGWDDQWIIAIGTQFKPTQNLFLRAGFNYGKNPVKEHNNFVGASMIQVQGKYMPTYYYETFRLIGFPAIVQNHLTLGIAYEHTNRFSIHAGYMHAFKKKIRESGTALNGQPVTLESGLSEDSIEFGLSWRF